MEQEMLSLLHGFDFKSAKEVFKEGIDTIKFINSGKIKPLITSIDTENEATGGLYPSDQMVIVGANSIGITTRVIAMIDDFLNPVINPTYENNIVVLYNSWEVAGWRNALKFLSLKSNRTVSDLLDIQKQKELQHIQMMETLASKYDNLPLFINNKSNSAKGWETATKNIINRFEGKTIINIVDNTKFLTRINFTNEESLVSDFMFMAHGMKNKFNCINIIVSSLRNSDFVKTISLGQKLPVPADVFAQSAVFSSSDIVVACHRPGFYGDTDFKISATMTANTGLMDISAKDDYLWIQEYLKNKYGESRRIYIKHDVKNGRFRKFTDSERTHTFKSKTRISTDDY
jgi:hypothetical protein